MCLTSVKRTEMARRNTEGSNNANNNNNNNNNNCKVTIMKNCAPKSRLKPKNNDDSLSSIEFDKKTVPLSPSPSRYSPISDSVFKQYAGCKWNEPPSPSTLPHPPKHWMQTNSYSTPFQKICKAEQDIAEQLKVLLKVQA